MTTTAGSATPLKYMTYYTDSDHPENYQEPKILHLIDGFLTQSEIKHYQSLCYHGWTLAPDAEKIKYFAKDLYRHYAWDGRWDDVRWLDSSPPDWEHLYDRISSLLPPHRVHWVDLKITPPLSTGTPLHRDKDPWIEPNTDRDFNRALTIICNLNTEWDESWGGALVLHQASRRDNETEFPAKVRIPISPGQLMIAENCYHSIETITSKDRYRISFILHALTYR